MTPRASPNLVPFLVKQGLNDWSNLAITTDDLNDADAAQTFKTSNAEINPDVEPRALAVHVEHARFQVNNADNDSGQMPSFVYTLVVEKGEPSPLE